MLDWIKKQPDLDADRVLVQGSSYGGYMSLSVASKYDDRIRGAISDSGATNLATFIERTEGWRRELRRAEFGDERNPKIKAFMERTAPLNNIRKIKKPLLIIQERMTRGLPPAKRTPWSTLRSDKAHLSGMCWQAMKGTPSSNKTTGTSGCIRSFSLPRNTCSGRRTINNRRHHNGPNWRSNMKKKKLILSSLFLALTLAFVSAGSVNVYADAGDPQEALKRRRRHPTATNTD